MKKLIGVLALVGGIWYFTKKTDQPTTPTNPVVIPKTEIQQFEGKIVIDANGNWTYVLNGILRPLSEKGLAELRAKKVEEIVISTHLWLKYPELQGAGY